MMAIQTIWWAFLWLLLVSVRPTAAQSETTDVFNVYIFSPVNPDLLLALITIIISNLFFIDVDPFL